MREEIINSFGLFFAFFFAFFSTFLCLFLLTSRNRKKNHQSSFSFEKYAEAFYSQTAWDF